MKEPSYLIHPELQAYAESHSESQDEVLYQLYRETNLKVLRPRMLSGHLQGLLLQFISRWKRPETILEIGTYTGYGTICLSRGMKKGGIIHTIEKNPEVLEVAKKYFDKEGISGQVKIYSADALQVLKKLDQTFDLVFIDGDKHEYPEYFNLVKPRVNRGGLILTDNVLWDGKILDKNSDDPETRSIQQVNRQIKEDNDFRNMLLPVRDGLMVAEKLR